MEQNMEIVGGQGPTIAARALFDNPAQDGKQTSASSQHSGRAAVGP